MARNIRNFFQKFYEFLTRSLTAVFNWFGQSLKKQPPLQPSSDMKPDLFVPPQLSIKEAQIEPVAKEAEQQKHVLAQEKERARMQAQLTAVQEAAEKKVKEAQEKAETEARESIANQLKLDEENNKSDLYKAIVKGDIASANECLSKIGSEEILKNPSELLYRALDSGHMNIIQLLMQYGVRLDFRCLSKGGQYRSIAVALKTKPRNIKIIKLLLSDPKVLITKDDLFKAWAIRNEACRKNNYPIKNETIFGCFLKSRVWTFYPDKKNSNNINDLNFFLSAIEEGHMDTIKRTLNALDARQTKIYAYPTVWEIVRQKANAHAYTWIRLSPVIELAIKFGQSEVARLLLQYYVTHKESISSEDTNYNEHDIFYCALTYHHREVAKLLLKSPNVNLNQRYQGVNSPDPAALYYAVAHKDHDLAELLIEAGATTFGMDLVSEGFEINYQMREVQLNTINDFKKQITFLYNEGLKCLDSVLHEAGIKKIIQSYVDGLSYIESPSPNPSDKKESVSPKLTS